MMDFDRMIKHVFEIGAPILARQLLGQNRDGTTKDLADVVREIVTDELADIAHIADVQGVVTSVETEATRVSDNVSAMFTPITGQLSSIPTQIIDGLRNLLPHFP